MEQSTDELTRCRERIDEIDQKLVELFEERMQVSERVAAFKIHTGKAVHDPVREAAKIESVQEMAHGDFNRQGTKELFRQIMAISRKRQYQIMTEAGSSFDAGFEKVESLPLPTLGVVYQGVAGAYSAAATREFFGDAEAVRAVPTWRDAMEAVWKGEADYAVLPIENSTAGIVSDIYDLLMRYELFIVGEQLVDVRHVLLGLPGASLSDIEKVCSHPQGLSQCQAFLEQHPSWEKVPMENTAGAAKMVSEAGDIHVAAIASREAGRLYGLSILSEEVCPAMDNKTRFIVVGKKPIRVEGARRVSICFELDHTWGSLYSLLSHIIYNGLNMTRIESRPIPEKAWEYRFFVDFEGSLDDSSVANALRGITQEANMARVLGNY